MCLEDIIEDSAVTRRTFLGAATITLGVAARQDQQTKQPETRVLDDPSIQHHKVLFKHGGKETIDGYLARPAADGIFPAVLVIAGNRITEEYILNTCAALAIAGFVGLAPNVFHPLGDKVLPPDEMRKVLADHTEWDVLADVQAGADFLRAQPFVKPGGIAALGFCFGGRMAILYGARNRDVDAVVAFHPGIVREQEIARFRGPVQIHHGTADHSVAIEESVRLEKALKRMRVPVKLFSYSGADHGFLAYTRPYYRPDYAKLAWSRTVEFLHAHLT